MDHGTYVSVRYIGAYQYHMGGTYTEVFLQFAVGYHVGHIFGKGFTEIVIHFIVGCFIRQIRRKYQPQEQDQEYREYLGDT